MILYGTIRTNGSVENFKGALVGRSRLGLAARVLEDSFAGIVETRMRLVGGIKWVGLAIFLSL